MNGITINCTPVIVPKKSLIEDLESLKSRWEYSMWNENRQKQLELELKMISDEWGVDIGYRGIGNRNVEIFIK